MDLSERLQLIREWLQPRKARLLGLFFSLAFFCYLATWAVPAFENWSQERGVRELAREARRHNLDCEDVVRQHAVGWTVHWRMTHPMQGQWAYGGGGCPRIEWSGPEPDLPFTGVSGGMNSVAVVANVVEAGPDKVVLSYQGRG